MRVRFALLFIFGLFASCNKESIKPNDQPDELRTDDTITVINSNPGAPTTSAKSPYNLLGHGYNVTGQFTDSSAAGAQVIDVAKLHEHDRVEIGITNTVSPKTIVSEDCAAYSQLLSSGMKATEGSRLFKGAITSYFPEQDALSDNYIYASYTLNVVRKRVFMSNIPSVLQQYVTDDFKKDIQNESPEKIVQKYGTHILRDILLGAKLVVMYQAETVNKDREKAAELGLTVAMNNVFKLFTGYLDYSNATSATGNFSQKISYKTFGGDMNKLIQTTSPGSKKPTVDISGWSQSLTTADEEFIDFNYNADVLVPLYEVIEDPVKREELKQYITTYLADNQVKI
ncbi:hypothetical protein H7F15_17620 [Pontibacter sp. Tf4]|uniref:MAC/perforin domain-containing protein n=1 Tax=Pontibacter sp. Tf4 TaxID=2761620 RepID=UPI00162A27F4|nr:MAC/perforin domain-containing protein [Pontibacter sp. Tf4]MBB6612865.1 hypothetical protein [Pontibacter sp. Tf4]